ncbi:MAG: glycosyltransferase family 2 protein [Chitinophagaceae bacterium]
MSTKPLVSVIIATYNRAHILEHAIRSALDQTYENTQIIVVDDGSTDNTADIVKAYPQVEYVLQPHGRQASARNNGWKHSNGKYIATLDSDDKWQPDFLEKCVDRIEKDNLDFVFTNWDQERIEGDTYDFLANDPYLQPFLNKLKDSWITLGPAELRELYIQSCPSPSSSLLIRSASLAGWNEQMNIGDDWCMLLDMIMSNSCRAAFTMEKLWLKHINCNNIYDGRDHIEVNRLFYVEDACTILNRYASALTKAEYEMLEKKYLKHLVRSAKHSLTNSNVKESLTLMKRAMTTNPFYATKVFTALLVQAGKRQFIKDPQAVPGA